MYLTHNIHIYTLDDMLAILCHSVILLYHYSKPAVEVAKLTQ